MASEVVWARLCEVWHNAISWRQTAIAGGLKCGRRCPNPDHTDDCILRTIHFWFDYKRGESKVRFDFNPIAPFDGLELIREELFRNSREFTNDELKLINLIYELVTLLQKVIKNA